MSPDHSPNFVILLILDGWGIAPEDPGNAIKIASTPNMDKLWSTYPHCELEASGEAVGLPAGEDGNTETGHINIGAGKIVYQSLKRIDLSISDGSFFKNEVLLNAIKHAKKNKSNLHYMGLIGSGGVHSDIEHLYALLRLASQNSFDKVYIHLFSDGRDSSPMSVKTYIKNLLNVIEKEGVGTIASIMGRYWAMDRDQRWNRTEKAYLALTQGKCNIEKNIFQVVDNSYKRGITDEFIEPTLIVTDKDQNTKLIQDNDAVIFFNFRVDRPRQLTKAFLLNDFSKADMIFDSEAYEKKYPAFKSTHNSLYKEPFPRGKKLENIYFVTMTQYSKILAEEGAKIAFPPEGVATPLSMVISNYGKRQLKITESEKERFVTYYFNGLREKPFPLEESIIIPSLKIPTYDQKPEMLAYEMTEVILKKLSTSDYQFIVVNYPNPDMVGHTGNMGATVKAVEVVDECVGKIANFVLAYGGLLMITADHGNAEEIINKETGEIDTEHSTNRVPFISVCQKFTGKSQTLRSGILADIAPTVLSVMNIEKPKSMTGRNLLSELKE